MSGYREQALSAIKALVVGGGSSLTDDDLSMFEQDPEEAGKHGKRLGVIYDAMLHGFFHCAAAGLPLGPENRVSERFGRSIERNYPEANDVFLRFAMTYWTLKVLVDDLTVDDREWIGAHMLGTLEQVIGPLFFPSPAQREKDQRELIEASGADIDIEKFMKGNPILLRDRSSSKGCLGTAVLLLLLCVTMLWPTITYIFKAYG